MQVVTKGIEDTDIRALRIHHINSIGAIVDNHLMFHSNDKSTIEIESIKKLQMFKTRSFSYNLLFAFCSSPLICVLYIRQLTNLEYAFICTFVVLLLGFAFFFKDLKYVLFITKFDLESIAIKVNKNNKGDAKKIVSIVNRRIKQLKSKKVD